MTRHDHQATHTGAKAKAQAKRIKKDTKKIKDAPKHSGRTNEPGLIARMLGISKKKG